MHVGGQCYSLTATATERTMYVADTVFLMLARDGRRRERVWGGVWLLVKGLSCLAR